MMEALRSAMSSVEPELVELFFRPSKISSAMSWVAPKPCLKFCETSSFYFITSVALVFYILL